MYSIRNDRSPAGPAIIPAQSSLLTEAVMDQETSLRRAVATLKAHLRSLAKESPRLAKALLFCAIAACAQAAPSSAKPRLTLDEFLNSVDITSVKLSPDGHMVAIGTERADWEAERFRKDLWLWRDSDNALIPLTQSGHDWSPEWSPDGKWIAFLSDRKVDSDSPDSNDDSADETHLYVIPVGGGEAFPVTRGEEGVHTFDWAPDSKTLYFATRTPWSSKQKDDYKSDWKDTVRYREQERGDVISRITVADALARRAAKGADEPKHGAKNTDEETAETPGAQTVVSSPYRVKSLAVSPDGARVAFLTDAISERLEGLKAIEIYVANTATAGAKNTAKQLTNNQAIEEHLEFAPDGKRIFFEVGQGSVESSYTDVQPRVYSLDSMTGEPTRWAAQFNGSINDYAIEARWRHDRSRYAGNGERALSTRRARQCLPQARWMAWNLRSHRHRSECASHRLCLFRSRQANGSLLGRQCRQIEQCETDHIV